MAAKNKAVAVKTAKDELAEYQQMTWEDIEAQNFVRPIGEVLESDQWGRVVNETGKRDFVGHPFCIAFIQFQAGKMGEFVTLMVIDKADDRFILNDGSTGVKEQLRSLYPDVAQKEVIKLMLLCPRGLRVSDYEVEDAKGNLIPATTYYLDTSV